MILQIRKRFIKRPKQYYFFAPSFSNTGAPYILLNLISDFISKFDPKNIFLVTPYIDEKNKRILQARGINIYTIDFNGTGNYFDYKLGILKDDFVCINTVSISSNLRDWLLGLLESNSLAKMYWYIHEDLPEIQFKDLNLKTKVSQFVLNDQLVILTPARKIQDNYQKYFSHSCVYAPYRFDLPTEFNTEITSDRFETVNFALNGSVYEGRKGQLMSLFAFILFEERFKNRDHNKYRNYSLNFIGVADSFIVKQVEILCEKYFPNNSKIYGVLEREEVFAVLAKTNCNFCYSFMEALPINVFENMWLGHFIMRNDCSGQEEQLIIGKNGYFLDTNNLDQVVDSIETVLNKEKTSNEQLWQMGQISKQIVEPYKNIQYLSYFPEFQ